MNSVRKRDAKCWDQVSASCASGELMSDTHKEVKQDPGGDANSSVKMGEGHL